MTTLRPSDVFPQAVQEIRQRRGWTQQQLADVLENIGAPIDRSTVAKIEAHKRGIGLDELFWFACALGVSPEALVIPRSDLTMQVAPMVDAPTPAVTAWWRNLHGLPHQPHDARIFDEARTDREAAVWRDWPYLRRMLVETQFALLVAATEPVDMTMLRSYLQSLEALAGLIAQLPAPLKSGPPSPPKPIRARKAKK